MADRLVEQRLPADRHRPRELSKLDLEAVLDQVLETAREITGARYAALGVWDRDRRELERFITRGIDATAHRSIGDLPRERGILGGLIDEPRPLRIPESRRAPEVLIAEWIASALRDAGIRVSLRRAYAVDSVSEYDAVIFGSPVFDQRWLPEGDGSCDGT